MGEAVAIKVAEANAWGELARHLDGMEKASQDLITKYKELMYEEFPEGGEEAHESWQYANIQNCRHRLAAYRNIRETILQVLG